MTAVRLVSTHNMDRSEWLSVRTRGIGGSDIAAIAGVSPWATPLSVYLDKIGEAPKQDETEAMRWGTILEDVVAREYARRHPEYTIRRVNAVLQHPEVPYFIGNIDREIRRAGHPPMLLEIKTTSAWNAGSWRDDVPDHVMCQVQWYLGILGWQTAVVAVLIGGQDYREIEIARDDEIIEQLQTIGRRFWEEHVIPRRAPAPEAGDVDTVAAMYPESNGQEIDLTPLAQDVLREYDEARAIEEAARQRRQAAEAKLKQLLGDHERALVGNRRVSWPTVVTRRLDTAALRADHPDIYEQYVRETTYRRFTVSKEKEGDA